MSPKIEKPVKKPSLKTIGLAAGVALIAILALVLFLLREKNDTKPMEEEAGLAPVPVAATPNAPGQPQASQAGGAYIPAPSPQGAPASFGPPPPSAVQPQAFSPPGVPATQPQSAMQPPRAAAQAPAGTPAAPAAAQAPAGTPAASAAAQGGGNNRPARPSMKERVEKTAPENRARRIQMREDEKAYRSKHK